MPPPAGGRHTQSGRLGDTANAQSRGYYDISRCPFSLMWMRRTSIILPFTQKVNIRRLLPVLCQMRCAQLEGLLCGDKPSRGAPHRSYQDGQAIGQRIYSFECSTPGRAHGKHAVFLRGRDKAPGSLDTSILPSGRDLKLYGCLRIY